MKDNLKNQHDIWVTLHTNYTNDSILQAENIFACNYSQFTAEQLESTNANTINALIEQGKATKEEIDALLTDHLVISEKPLSERLDEINKGENLAAYIFDDNYWVREAVKNYINDLPVEQQEIIYNDIRQTLSEDGKSFINNEDKMRDFRIMSKENFLSLNSFFSETDYNCTILDLAKSVTDFYAATYELENERLREIATQTFSADRIDDSMSLHYLTVADVVNKLVTNEQAAVFFYEEDIKAVITRNYGELSVEQIETAKEVYNTLNAPIPSEIDTAISYWNERFADMLKDTNLSIEPIEGNFAVIDKNTNEYITKDNNITVFKSPEEIVSAIETKIEDVYIAPLNTAIDLYNDALNYSVAEHLYEFTKTQDVPSLEAFTRAATIDDFVSNTILDSNEKEKLIAALEDVKQKYTAFDNIKIAENVPATSRAYEIDKILTPIKNLDEEYIIKPISQTNREIDNLSELGKSLIVGTDNQRKFYEDQKPVFETAKMLSCKLSEVNMDKTLQIIKRENLQEKSENLQDKNKELPKKKPTEEYDT